MATTKEIDRELADRLYDLLMIKALNAQHVKWLDSAIARTKTGMSKEAISWVEQQVKDTLTNMKE